MRAPAPNEGYLLTETATGARQMVGARNARYKVVCMDSAENCEFYDLVDDPLEEYPLSAPRNCADATRTWTPADVEWHYCQLTQVVASESFFADAEARAARAAARGPGAPGRGAGAGPRGAGPGGRGGARGGRGAAPN